MMKQISKLCSHLMMVSVVASGVAALALVVRDNPPGWMAPLAEHANQITITALTVAFAAASFASLQATADFVRALRAGAGHRLTMVVSAMYAACCIVIEVVVGKAGLAALNINIPDVYLILACTFFAVAPRMRALIEVGIAAIEREEAKADDKDEKAHDLKRLEIIERERRERIEAGVRSLDDERKARTRALGGLLVAPALATGAFAGNADATTHTVVREVEQPVQHPRTSVLLEDPAEPSLYPAAHTAVRDALFGLSVTKGNEDACGRFLALIDADPSISNRRMERILRAEGHGTHRTTIGVWKRKLKEAGVLAYPGNEDLLDRTA